MIQSELTVAGTAGGLAGKAGAELRKQSKILTQRPQRKDKATEGAENEIIYLQV